MKTHTIVPGRINRPLGQFQGRSLLEAVSLRDLTGVAASLQRVSQKFIQYRLLSSKTARLNLRPGLRPLPIQGFADMDKDEFTNYVGDVVSKLQVVGCPSEGYYLLGSSDFWWDTDNDVFLSFDKQFIIRLPVIVPVSLRASSQRRCDDPRGN